MPKQTKWILGKDVPVSKNFLHSDVIRASWRLKSMMGRTCSTTNNKESPLWGALLVNDGFAPQRASNTESVLIAWRFHDQRSCWAAVWCVAGRCTRTGSTFTPHVVWWEGGVEVKRHRDSKQYISQMACRNMWHTKKRHGDNDIPANDPWYWDLLVVVYENKNYEFNIGHTWSPQNPNGPTLGIWAFLYTYMEHGDRM